MTFIITFSKLLIIHYSKRVKRDTNRFSHSKPINKNFIFKNYLDEYEEYKTYDENDIILILRGLQNILSYFINIKYQFTKKRENFDKNFWIKFINDFHNQTKQNFILKN